MTHRTPARWPGLILLLSAFATAASPSDPANSPKPVAAAAAPREKTSRGFWSSLQGPDKSAATFATGDRLLREAQASHNHSERILKLVEGLDHLLCAATNRNADACARLAEAFGTGTGVPTNSATAYAWMKLAAQFDRAFSKDLDQLAVSLEPKDILQGQRIARDYSAGNWPACIARPVVAGDPRLVIQGINLSNSGGFVIVNGATFAARDTSEVRSRTTPNSRLTVTCVEIGGDYALFSVQGETSLKLLSTVQLTR